MADKKLVPLKSIIVAREGRRVSPPLNKAFPFTAEEVEALTEGVDYRKAINEDDEADLAEVTALSRSPHVREAKTNGAGAGKTTAMENGADGAAPTGNEQGEGQTSDSAQGKTPAKPKKAPATPPASDDDL